MRSVKVALAVAVAMAAIANPAFAQKKKALEAYASASQGQNIVVGWDGRVVGTDPDKNIRFQLMRDAFANEN